MRHLHIWRTGPLVAHITAHAQEKKKKNPPCYLSLKGFLKCKEETRPPVSSVLSRAQLCVRRVPAGAHILCSPVTL